MCLSDVFWTSGSALEQELQRVKVGRTRNSFRILRHSIDDGVEDSVHQSGSQMLGGVFTLEQVGMRIGRVGLKWVVEEDLEGVINVKVLQSLHVGRGTPQGSSGRR